MNNKIVQFLSHTILILGVLLMVVPIWIAFASSTHENVTILKEGMQWGLGDQLVKNYNEVLNQKGGFSQEITATRMFINSFIMAFGIASVKVIISSMSAYAIVYFRFKLSCASFLVNIYNAVGSIRSKNSSKLSSCIGLKFNKFLYRLNSPISCVRHGYFFLQAVLQICPR